MSNRRNRILSGIAVAAMVGLCALSATPAAFAMAGADDPFPEARPLTGAGAAKLLADRADASGTCLVPALRRLGSSVPFGQRPGIRLSLHVLRGEFPLEGARLLQAEQGLRVRYTVEPGAAGRVDPADLDGNGRPDLLDAVLQGWSEATNLVEAQLGIAAPQSTEIVLADLGEFDGYVVTETNGVRIVLHASPTDGAAGARRAAMHHAAHAAVAASAPDLPGEWDEAFASWIEIAIDDDPGAALAERLSARTRRLASGLLDDDLALAAGNALWLAFLDELHGRTAVRVTLEELSGGGDVETALDHALARVSGDDAAGALREFQLWTILVGDRADGLHFSFADRLTDPGFASTARGLPALSVRADRAVGTLGASQVLLLPHAEQGGMRVRFEGDCAARWQADLILVDTQGMIRRLGIPLSETGGGELLVPLEGLAEAMLLARNLGSEDGQPHSYTYAASLETDYPYVLAAMSATELPDADGGVLVTWETASERQMVGYDVIREQEPDGRPVQLNPVWIPAVGDESHATEYHFLDRSAEQGASYRYRIRGVTLQGLFDLSPPVRTGGAPR